MDLEKWILPTEGCFILLFTLTVILVWSSYIENQILIMKIVVIVMSIIYLFILYQFGWHIIEVKNNLEDKG